MSRVCVYYPSDNDEGYVWESILPSEIDAFLSQGWTRKPDFSDLPPKVSVPTPSKAVKKIAKPAKKK